VIYRFKLIVPLTYKDVEVESEEVELSDLEITLIRQLVGQSPSKRYGLMPILEDGAPELYDKLWNAIEQPLRDVVLEDGRKNGFVKDADNDEELDIDCVSYLCKIPDFAK
jgi:hypothetical protein